MILSRSPNLTSNLLASGRRSLLRFRTMSTEEDDVIFEDHGNKGLVILNRPKALNAVNLPLVNKLYAKLSAWEREKSLVVIKGAGGKAFSPGGDLKSILEARLRGDNRAAHTFFKQVYRTCSLLGSYKVPSVALIDGIVMGGSVGLAMQSPYRICTERSICALPEVQVGLFPDVGGGYYLPRMAGKLGLYLALTGYRLRGNDLLKAGIATHCIDSKNLEALESDLLKCDELTDVNCILKGYSVSKDNSEFSLAPRMEQINHCFGANSVEGIVKRLEEDGSEWAKETIETLNKMSPTSLKVTMKQLEYGRKMSLDECLRMEYRITFNCLANKDFLEGIRVALIDRDRKPAWSPSTLAEVSQTLVDSYFAKLPENEELCCKL